jgi:hypothetical protein
MDLSERILMIATIDMSAMVNGERRAVGLVRVLVLDVMGDIGHNDPKHSKKQEVAGRVREMRPLDWLACCECSCPAHRLVAGSIMRMNLVGDVEDTGGMKDEAKLRVAALIVVATSRSTKP